MITGTDIGKQVETFLNENVFSRAVRKVVSISQRHSRWNAPADCNVGGFSATQFGQERKWREAMTRGFNENRNWGNLSDYFWQALKIPIRIFKFVKSRYKALNHFLFNLHLNSNTFLDTNVCFDGLEIEGRCKMLQVITSYLIVCVSQGSLFSSWMFKWEY